MFFPSASKFRDIILRMTTTDLYISSLSSKWKNVSENKGITNSITDSKKKSVTKIFKQITWVF